MGMFDYYIPDPPILMGRAPGYIPVWQGKDSHNDLLVWMQGHAAPVGIGDPDDRRFLLANEDDGDRLPDEFTIYVSLNIRAKCTCENGCWVKTKLIIDNSITNPATR